MDRFAQKQELISCLDVMWAAFARNVSIKQEADVQSFLEAKERAHQLVASLEEPKEAQGEKDGV